jgi:aldose 1-epimerase
LKNENIIEEKLSLSAEIIKQIDGRDIYKIFLSNGKLSVLLTNIGCSIIAVEAPDRNAVCKNIVSGFSNVEEYLQNRDYMGCVVGRYANRIANGQFVLDGKQYNLPVNNKPNHLHGGEKGFSKKIWNLDATIQTVDKVGVRFNYLSNDGEEGYPGNLLVQVTCSLNMNDQLCIEYEAETNKATPVNFTNHTYFNLTGFETDVIDDHLLQVNAYTYTEKNEANVPTGKMLPVKGSALDFSILKKIGDGIDQFPADMGYDHNFVLERNTPGELVGAAKLYEPMSGRIVNVYTTQPGIQLYTANYWDGTVKGAQGNSYQQHGGVALETQSFPDSPNQPHFPNTILRPGQHYFSKTIYEFGIE